MLPIYFYISRKAKIFISHFSGFYKDRAMFSLICVLSFSSFSQANGYIQFSDFLGGSAAEQNFLMKHEGPYVYVSGVTNSANYPTTMGGGLLSSADVVVTKLDTAGNVIYSRYIGSRASGLIQPRPAMSVENGYVYLCFLTSAGAFPTSNGSNLNGLDDFLIVKLDSVGNIVFSTYWGGSNREAEPNIAVENGDIYIAGISFSINFPTSVASGAVMEGGAFVLTKFNSSGSLQYSRLWGGSTGAESQASLRVDNGFAYVAGVSTSLDYPATIGTSPNQQGSLVVAKVASDGSFVYNRLMAGNGTQSLPRLEVHNGNAYLAGYSSSTNYPVLGGYSYPGGGSSYVLSKIEPGGLLGYSTYVGGSDSEDGKSLAFTLDNGLATLMGASRSVDFPVTNGSVHTGNSTFVLAKFSNSGALLFGTYLGGINAESSPFVTARDGYILAGGNSSSANFPVTNGSVLSDNDFVVTLFGPTGNLIFSSFLGGAGSETGQQLVLGSDYAIVGGYVSSSGYPVTTTSSKSGSTDFAWTLLRFCPEFDETNEITPDVQSICENGVPELLVGNDILANGANLPLIYRQGVVSTQGNIAARYRWQEAADENGPWSDIPWGVTRDFQAPAAVSDRFYRRIALESELCGGDTISVSNIAVVMLNGFISPEADAGGLLYTCPGVPVTLGGNPSASGGEAPYTYLWDVPAVLSDVNDPNPIATVSETAILTLLVTDNNGCTDIDQVVVRVVRANAGPDRVSCAGNSVQIGTPAIPGVPGLVYEWTPASFLSNTAIAQPLSAPDDNVTYLLTITVPLQDGSSCDVSDMMNVEAVKGPSDPDFAGKDVITCADKGPIAIGGPAEAGYTYTWSPGNYLNSVNGATTIFNSNNDIPNPDPFIYYLTATRGQCSFVDDLKVTVIEARAGRDGCGPRTIGSGDRTPLINETYLWKLVSGPGSITGPDDTPTTTVSASVGSPSTYLLSVCLDDTCCEDEVVVPDCGCDIMVAVNAPSGCPQFDNGPVTLIATAGSVYVSDPNEFTYTWSPCDGLSACTGRIVSLTDHVPRTYTVTMTSPIDNDFSCFTTVAVNDPAWATPVFSAADAAVCRGDSVMVGAAPVAGYSYQWTGPNGFSSLSSNPFVRPLTPSEYIVTVTEQVSGCFVRDTVEVSVTEVIANAGLDWTICELAIVELGTSDLSGGNSQFQWSPVIAPWQSGTDDQSAQPIVLIATSLEFTLTVTDMLSGCQAFDTVLVTVNNNPTLPPLSDVVICPGDSVLIGVPSSPGVAYNWLPSTGLSCPSCPETWASPNSDMSYTLTATYPGNCTSTPTTSVSISVSDPSFDLGFDLFYCPSDGAIYIGSTAPLGMASYEWSPDIFISNTDTREVFVFPPYPVDYVLTIVDLNGCPASDTIQVAPINQPPFAGNDATICAGASVVLGSPGISGSITWYGGDGYLSCTNCPNPVFSANEPGVYTLTIEVEEAGCFTYDEVVITVDVVKLMPMAATTICQQACTTIGVDPVFGINYVWSPATGISSPFSASTEVCPTATTTYTLTAVSALSGCVASQNVTVGVAPVPAPQVSVPALSLCIGSDPGSFSPVISPVIGDYSFLWTPSVGLSDPYDPFTSVIPLSSGTRSYQLTVADNATGCSNTASAQVTTLNCNLLLFGTVFYDINGLADNTVNGTGISYAGSTPLYVALASAETGAVLSITTLGIGGTYSFPVSANRNYVVKLFDAAPAIGALLPANSLPPNWLFMGDNIGIGPGSDGLIDGLLEVAVANMNVYHVNFGIADFNILPVELLHFSVEKLDYDKALLTWATASELNNDRFEVLRASDDMTWGAMATIAGSGSSNLRNDYSWIDREPLAGNNYYRLRQVDYDGTYSLSPIRMLSFEAQQWLAKVFPNPFTTWLQIEHLPLEADLEAFLYNETGQLVKFFRPLQSNTLSMAGVPVGKYFLVIRRPDSEQQQVFKLLKF
jgi:hypothetical protein